MAPGYIGVKQRTESKHRATQSAESCTAMPVQIEAILAFRCASRWEKGASREGRGERPGDHLKPFCAGPLVAAADWLAALRIVPSTQVSRCIVGAGAAQDMPHRKEAVQGGRRRETGSRTT